MEKTDTKITTPEGMSFQTVGKLSLVAIVLLFVTVVTRLAIAIKLIPVFIVLAWIGVLLYWAFFGNLPTALRKRDNSH